jgi:histidine kinase-like protein
MSEPTAPAFELLVPPDAAFVATARLFAAAVGRTVGCDEGSIEDLKLAVSEAVTAGLRAGASEQITVRAERLPTVLRIEVEPVPAEVSNAEEDGPAGVELIRLVFQDVEHSEQGGSRPRIGFSVPLGQPS